MGAIGVCYWLFKSFLVFYWATTMEGEPRDYFIWTATKSLTRGTCSVFQIILLLKINEKALGTNVDRRNHMIVPALMIGMLAIFIGSAADQYLGKVDTKVRLVCFTVISCIYSKKLPRSLKVSVVFKF